MISLHFKKYASLFLSSLNTGLNIRASLVAWVWVLKVKASKSSMWVASKGLTGIKKSATKEVWTLARAAYWMITKMQHNTLHSFSCYQQRLEVGHYLKKSVIDIDTKNLFAYFAHFMSSIIMAIVCLLRTIQRCEIVLLAMGTFYNGT